MLTVWSNRNSFIAGGMQNTVIGKNVQALISNTSNPPMVLLGIYPNELKTYIPYKPCTPMSLTAFFMIVKNWKQSRCSSIIEWTNHGTMDYSGLFWYKKKWLPQERMKELKCIFLSERRQSEKPTYCMIPAVWYSGRGKNMKTVERWLWF